MNKPNWFIRYVNDLTEGKIDETDKEKIFLKYHKYPEQPGTPCIKCKSTRTIFDCEVRPLNVSEDEPVCLFCRDCASYFHFEEGFVNYDKIWKKDIIKSNNEWEKMRSVDE